jgi:hypothetical protein
MFSWNASDQSVKVNMMAVRRLLYLEEFHCEVDAVNFAVGDLKVSRPCSTSADDDGIILCAKLLGANVDPYMRVVTTSVENKMDKVTGDLPPPPLP